MGSFRSSVHSVYTIVQDLDPPRDKYAYTTTCTCVGVVCTDLKEGFVLTYEEDLEDHRRTGGS
jgi:hypothetical protein